MAYPSQEKASDVTAPRNPLVGPPPDEVPLAAAPLVRVITQVRFPVIASVERRDFIGPFQEAIRATYPILRPEQNRNLLLGERGVVEERTTTAWRFFDEEGHWIVTLAPDFLALETSHYSNRNDLLERFQLILGAVQTHLNPGVIDRLGVRYISRVTGANLEDLQELIRPEVRGILATSLHPHVFHSLTDNLLVLPGDGRLTARWGVLPADATVDPAAIEPIGERSWILDLDAFRVFQGGQGRLEAQTVLAEARAFAERIYSVFRWAVTDEFLRRYGGQP